MEYQNHSPTRANGDKCQYQLLIHGKRWEELIKKLTYKDFRTLRDNNARGWALLETGRYQQAVDAFREVLDRCKNKNIAENQIYFRAAYRYCFTNMKLGNYDEVIGCCNTIQESENLLHIDQIKRQQFQTIKKDAQKKRLYVRYQNLYQTKIFALERPIQLRKRSRFFVSLEIGVEFQSRYSGKKAAEIIFGILFFVLQKKRQYYLISEDWLKKWSQWINCKDANESTYPGPVDNSSLLRKISDVGCIFLRNPTSTQEYTNLILKPQIREDSDFIFVNQETFLFFKERYGFQQEIKRQGMQDDDEQGSIFIDLHLKLIRCMMLPINPIFQNIYTKFVLQISRKQSINQLKARIRQILKIYQSKYQQFEIHIWKLDGIQAQEGIINGVKRLETSPQYRSKVSLGNQKIKIQGKKLEPLFLIDQSQILPQDTLFIEVKETNSKSIFQSNKTQTTRVLPSDLMNGNHQEQTKISKIYKQKRYIDFSYMKIDLTKQFNHYSGKNGLKNIGNTCFLASALQCLSNTQLLTKYFITRQFAASLNKSNKLGTGGQLAYAYYKLLLQLWTQRGSTAPWQVKKQVARKARQFAGYNQQDSSQFLNFLIDTLHEDMNLIKQKPYIQYKDSDGRPDDVVSHQYWNNFLSRNKSIMVELMYGQLKSKLRCLACNRISNTFDPFAILSLPIPINLNMDFNYLTKNREIVNINAKITDRTSFLELAQQFMNYDKVLQVADPSHIMAVAIINGKIAKIFEIGNSIYGQKQILQKSDLVYYDIGLPYAQLIQKGYQVVETRTYVYGSSKNSVMFCPEILIVDPSQCTLRELKQQMFNKNLIYIEEFNEQQSRVQNGDNPRCLKYGQAFDEQTGEALIPDLYKLGIAQTIKKQSSFFGGTKYQCQLTGQKNIDPQIGVDLNSLQPKYLLKQLFDEMKKKVTNFKRLIINSVWPQNSKIMKARIANSNKVAHQYSLINKKSSSSKSETTLQNCLSAFRSEQVLDGQDKWYCSKCKEHQRAKKKMDLFKLPKILIIQLKRFKQRGRASYFWGPTCEKNSKLITFPTQNLDLSEYVLQGSPHHGKKEDCLYDLYGVVHHMGSLYGGHYIASALNFIDDRWYTYDDSHVSGCRNIQEIVSSSAYVLFYKRKNIKLNE